MTTKKECSAALEIETTRRVCPAPRTTSASRGGVGRADTQRAMREHGPGSDFITLVSHARPKVVDPVVRQRRRFFSAVFGVLSAGAAIYLLLLLTDPLTNRSNELGKSMNDDGIVSGIGLSEQAARMTALFTKVPVPDSFDVRWGFAECRGFAPINRIGGWGSTCKPSYAMLVSAMLSARTCRATRGSLNILLSPQSIIDCYQGGDGCADGTVENALTTLETQPAVDSICMPLVERPGLGYIALPGKCGTDTCSGATKYYLKANSRGSATAPFSSNSRVVTGDVQNAWVYKAGTEVAVPQSVEPLQQAILNGGPVLGKINYYKSSKVGIRTDPLTDPISSFHDSIPALYYGPGELADDEKPDAVHDVLVLGWGRDGNGVPYWIVMDTIGECYGDRGVFKIAMGVNAGNFEGYGFTYADLDIPRAVEAEAVNTFLGACRHDVEVHGACRHSGVLSQNGCQCKCGPRWTGPRCKTCNLQCQNGGIINNFNVQSGGHSVETCRCDCPSGFVGLECEQTCPNIKPFIY